MIIDFPDGSSTDGHIDYRKEPVRLNLDAIDLHGDRILDIAANDGFWSFWAEKRNASEVLAIDIDDIENYDWGYKKTDFSKYLPLDRSENFYKIKKILNSKVERKKISVYDLDVKEIGIFDLIFVYGLIYHLRHPLLAIDKVRTVCDSTMIIRTNVINYGANIPLSVFYEDDVFNGPTNWNGANISCILHWLKNAGFEHLFIEKKNINIYGMVTFCACLKKDKFYNHFKKSNILLEINKDYFLKARGEIQDLLKRR